MIAASMQVNDVDPRARKCTSVRSLFMLIGQISGIGEPSWSCHWPPTLSDSIHTWIIVLLAIGAKRYNNQNINLVFYDFLLLSNQSMYTVCDFEKHQIMNHFQSNYTLKIKLNQMLHKFYFVETYFNILQHIVQRKINTQ